MLRRRKVRDALDVRGPLGRLWVLRPGDDESSVAPIMRSIEHQLLQRRLTVGAIGAEISQIPSDLLALRGIQIRINRAIQRQRARRPELPLQSIQRWPACE